MATAICRKSSLEGARVFKVKLLDVRRDRVQLANGHESIREYIMHQGAVVIIPLLENGNLLFERQSRYPLRASILELPAGKIDSGEDIFNTGKA